ncbi:MAG: tetratricopeptide repeat protein, partial [Candidatus Krumholzibacteriia bacterium]
HALVEVVTDDGLRGAGSDPEQLNINAHALADIRQVAQVVPHAIVVDDAHRLDSGSRAFLTLMALSAVDMGVVLLVGARSATGALDSIHDGEGSLEEALETARQAGAVRYMRLRELGSDEVVSLVRRRFGSSHEFDMLAQRILDLTRGHPFFVTEALQNLVLTEQLRRDRQGWHLAPNTQRKLLPRMADTILSEHIAAARAEDRRVYEVLALLPSGAQAETLARILGEEAETARRALENGVAVGLLEAHGEPLSYAFRHELIREACAARCPDATSRRSHRRIADALQGTPAEAYHRLCAGESTPRSRACFLEVAEGYKKRGAPWEAVRYYEAALEIDSQADDADGIALSVARLRIQVGRAEEAARLLLQRLVAVRRPLPRARYLQRLGEAYSKQGRNDEALFHLQAATDLFQKHADADEKCQFVADLARVLLAKGDYAAATERCKQALGDIRESASPTSRAILLLLKGRAERQSGDYGVAEQSCREALEILKPHGRTLELAQSYTEIGMNYYYRGEFEQAERFHKAALKVHHELDDLNGMKSAHNNLGLAQMRAGRLEEAIRSYERSLDLKRQLGDVQGEGSSLNNLGNLWEQRGEHRRALNCYRRGISIFRRLQRPRELATLYNNMGEVHLRLGRFNSALRYVDRAAEQLRGLEGAYVTQVVVLNRGAILLHLLDNHEATRVLNEALQRVRQSGLPALAAQYHAYLSLAYARAEDPPQAALHEQLAREALPELESEVRLVVLLALAETAESLRDPNRVIETAGEAEKLATEVERQHGRVRAFRLMAAARLRLGDWDVAEALLDEAIDLARALGFRYEVAKCCKILGVLHWDIGLRSRAEAEFERCFELLQGLGLKTELGLSYLEVARLSTEGETAS